MHMQHPEEVTVKPIYDTSKIKGVTGVNLLSTDSVALSKSIAEPIENNQEVQPAAKNACAYEMFHHQFQDHFYIFL